MKAFVVLLPLLGLVCRIQADLTEVDDSLLAHEASLDDPQRSRRSPEPFRGSVGGGSGIKLPPGVTVFNPKPKWPDAYNNHRGRRSAEPEPVIAPCNGGTCIRLPSWTPSPYNPNPRPFDTLERHVRSPNSGNGVRPPPSWNPPIRPIPIAPPRPFQIPRDPGRPWLRMRRSPGGSGGYRPQPNWRPPVRPIPIRPQRPKRSPGGSGGYRPQPNWRPPVRPIPIRPQRN